MVDYLWSQQVQGAKTLDYSRDLRFRDDRSQLYLQLLGLKPGMTVLDVGCGPGTLTRKLAKWLGPETRVIGVDRDRAFIDYARQMAEQSGLSAQLAYHVGDALDLPLADNSVDAVTSHTVIEHVPHEPFLLEQQRVCRPGGRVSVQAAWVKNKIATEVELEKLMTPREAELWEKISPAQEQMCQEHNIGRYWPDLVELPQTFERLGFKNIQVDAIYFPEVIDDDRHDFTEKRKMIESKRQQVLEMAFCAFRLANCGLSEAEQQELVKLINQRFDTRLQILERGQKLWDYAIHSIWIVSGEV